jgi:hypothetical protein
MVELKNIKKRRKAKKTVLATMESADKKYKKRVDF